MKSIQAKVFVTLKSGVLDPQGDAVLHALQSLGHDSLKQVRQGKFFEVSLEGVSQGQAEEQLNAMCKALLANTVIENYRYEIL